MLNWGFVLQRLKEEISLPFQHIEKTDDEIIDYCKRNVLKKYDYYFPQKWRLTLDTSDTDLQVPNRASEFYIIDPDGRDIYNISEFIPTFGPSAITGHPIFGPMSFEGLESNALELYKANNLKVMSRYNYNTEFIYPNQLRISPKFSGRATIEYERGNDPELSTIRPDMHDIFIDLCLGMFQMMIGKIRKKFSNIATPFGEIQINGDDIYSDGKEIYDRTIEALKTNNLPNIVFDHG